MTNRDKAVAKHGFYRAVGKRALDIILACVMLVILSLPMLIIALVIKLDSSGGVIFKQTRIGRGGEPFVCYKFRSMLADAPHDLPSAEFDAPEYITPVGRFLRRTSLDELPQIVNVIKGDMSFVGVRPLIPCEEALHKGRALCGAYELRPGITGLAQICGRDMISDAEKLGFDAEYAKNVGFALDVRIFFLTFSRVLRREDIRVK